MRAREKRRLAEGRRRQHESALQEATAKAEAKARRTKDLLKKATALEAELKEITEEADALRSVGFPRGRP